MQIRVQVCTATISWGVLPDPVSSRAIGADDQRFAIVECEHRVTSTTQVPSVALDAKAIYLRSA